MKKVYECNKNIVVSPDQYFAKKGEKIFQKNSDLYHVDSDDTTLYLDDNFKLSEISDPGWILSNDFEAGFRLLSKEYKKNYDISSLNELKRISSKEPIVIGGCGRSGTTLLLSILGAHSNIFAIPEETHAFFPKPFRLSRLLSYLKRNKENLRWCEKTPKNIVCYNDIINLFDGKIKIINMIRDGRDVITSIHPNGGEKYWVSKERWIKDNLSLWEDIRILNVKFEDLIAFPKETLIEICNHVGENFEESLLEYHKLTNVKNNIAWSESARPIDKALNHRSARWKQEEHADRVKKFMKDSDAIFLMKKFGYID